MEDLRLGSTLRSVTEYCSVLDVFVVAEKKTLDTIQQNCNSTTGVCVCVCINELIALAATLQYSVCLSSPETTLITKR